MAQFKSWAVYASSAAQISFSTHPEPPFPPLAGAEEVDTPCAEGFETLGHPHVGEGCSLSGDWETVPSSSCADRTTKTTEEPLPTTAVRSPGGSDADGETWELVEAAQAKPEDMLEGSYHGSADVDAPQAGASDGTSSVHADSAGVLEGVAKDGSGGEEEWWKSSGFERLVAGEAANAGLGEEDVACSCGEQSGICEPSEGPAEEGVMAEVEDAACNEGGDIDSGGATRHAMREARRASTGDGDGDMGDAREMLRACTSEPDDLVVRSELEVQAGQRNGGTPGVTEEAIREMLREYADRPDFIRMRSGAGEDRQCDCLSDGGPSANNILPLAGKLSGVK